MVYLSESKKETKEIERQIQKLASEQSKGFKSLTILDLAKEVLADKKLYLLYASDGYIINKALEILKEDAEFLEKCQLNYRKLIIEKLEKTTAFERQFIEFLDSKYTELILNIYKKHLSSLKN